MYRLTKSLTALTCIDMKYCVLLQGISYDEAMKVRKANLTPGLLTYYKNPIMIVQGHMQWLWDSSGKRYLDLFGGIVTVSVGHCHP